MIRKLLTLGILLYIIPVSAQQKGTVDIFMGADLHYRNINYSRMYDVLLNLTPGVKWNMGNRKLILRSVSKENYRNENDCTPNIG